MKTILTAVFVLLAAAASAQTLSGADEDAHGILERSMIMGEAFVAFDSRERAGAEFFAACRVSDETCPDGPGEGVVDPAVFRICRRATLGVMSTLERGVRTEAELARVAEGLFVARKIDRLEAPGRAAVAGRFREYVESLRGPTRPCGVLAFGPGEGAAFEAMLERSAERRAALLSLIASEYGQ